MKPTSWRTTTCGIVLLVGCASKLASDLLQGHPVDVAGTIACVTAAIGFFHAADHKAIS